MAGPFYLSPSLYQKTTNITASSPSSSPITIQSVADSEQMPLRLLPASRCHDPNVDPDRNTVQGALRDSKYTHGI
ncbi:hypothetical protein HAX54_038777, partial [Datura stramonium]|nr:hypothetical protein [Datura stramonium]